MASKNMPPIYQAIDAFYVGGQFVSRGDTVVEGHPLLKGRKKLFRPFVPTFGAPDEPEPTSEPDASPQEPTA